MSHPTATHLVLCVTPDGITATSAHRSYERACELVRSGRAQYPDHQWMLTAVCKVPPKRSPSSPAARVIYLHH